LIFYSHLNHLIVVDLVLSKTLETNEHINYLKDALNTKMQWKSKNNHFVALKTNSDMTLTIVKQILG